MNNSLVFVRPLSRRGQVVLPKDIRAHLGLKNEVVFEVHDDRVEIRPSAAGLRGAIRRLNLAIPEEARVVIKRYVMTRFMRRIHP